MNRIAFYAVALAVVSGYIIAEIVEILLLFFKSRKCQRHIAVKNSSNKYAWDISIIILLIFMILYRGITFYPSLERYTKTIENNLIITLYLLASLFLFIRFVFGRTAYITEKGIIGTFSSYCKNEAKYSIKRIGGETLLKIYTNSENPDVTYTVKYKNERKALALMKRLYPEYNGEITAKRNRQIWRHYIFYIGYGLLCTGALTAWYFVTMPVIFVGDKIVKTDSEYAIFHSGMFYENSVIPNDISEKVYEAIDISEKITSKDTAVLKKMPNLKYLDIMCNNIDDLTEIGDLTQLEMLRFGGGNKYEKPKDYSPLKKLKNIKYFTGAGLYELNDLTLFEDMDDLVYFELTFADIQTGLDVICEKENLLYLDLICCKAENFSPIGKCVKLKTLILDDTNVTDLSFLENLKELEHLGIDNVKAEDYSVLLELPSLKKLRAAKCDIPDEIINELTEKGVKIY